MAYVQFTVRLESSIAGRVDAVIRKLNANFPSAKNTRASYVQDAILKALDVSEEREGGSNG